VAGRKPSAAILEAATVAPVTLRNWRRDIWFIRGASLGGKSKVKRVQFNIWCKTSLLAATFLMEIGENSSGSCDSTMFYLTATDVFRSDIVRFFRTLIFFSVNFHD
jgi:hypothetical protein